MVLVANGIKAQEIRDAVRYSQDNLNGTARFRAMGGAFGALGGDLSAIGINPAGSAIFNNNQVGFSLNNSHNTNNSDYFGGKTTDDSNSFTMNQIGGVFVFNSQYKTSDWKKIAVAINYERNNNLTNSIFSAGVNPTNSIDSYFLSYANGVQLNVLENYNYDELGHGAQQAFLGYQSYIIDPVNTNANNTSYKSAVPAGGNYYQENKVVSKGYTGKLVFNAATSYKDILFIGLNLNSHYVDFRQKSRFYEENSANLTSNYTISTVDFSNDLYTYGTGFSFQLGGIVKLDGFRFGLVYDSPTWYRLNDEFTQRITTVSEKLPTIAGANSDSTTDTVNPNVTNYYDPYKLQTPGKWTGSTAYVFGKKGLISIDYSIKDYSNTTFRPKNDSYFSGLNSDLNSLLSASSELRIGGEYKINLWSLRAGYRQEQSPYKNKLTIGDLTGYSAGLGYNFGGTKLDLAYSTFKRSYNHAFFDKGFTDGAMIATKNSSITLTLLFEL